MWIPSFCTILCLAIYEWGISRKEVLKAHLEERITSLKLEKASELTSYHQLKEQLASKSDPNWIKLVMKKELGVIELGETKIIFKVVD